MKGIEGIVQAELEIMTDNLRSSPSVRTNTPRKSFSDLQPDDYYLAEGEMRSYIDPRSLKEPAVKEVRVLIIFFLSKVVDSLLSWLNQSLADSRVRLVDLEDDLKDGMVLKLLLVKLTGQPIELPCGDFVQSKERQKTNVEFVLQKIRLFS